MTTITVQTTKQLPWYEVLAECGTKTPISDAAAVTIAAGWQSPGTAGAAFAQLASVGSVAADALAADLDRAAHALRTRPGDHEAADLLTLAALIDWFDHHTYAHH